MAATGDLAGRWRVARTGGLLPPLGGVRKEIEGTTGWTVLGPLRLPFDASDGRLRDRAPLRGLVDVLEPDGPDAFRGRALVFGVQYGTFRMERL